MPEVELFELGGGRTCLEDLEDDLTVKQISQVRRQLERLEKHGRGLGQTYFEKIATSERGLGAFRLSAGRVEVRLLYRQVGDVFVILLGFVKKRRDIPAHLIQTADGRYDKWKEGRL